MSAFPRWLRQLFRRSPSPAPADASSGADPAALLLERARALAREGKLHEAARTYLTASRKFRRPEILLEHAELLLEIGDGFGAASNASEVLRAEPDNAHALAIRRRLLEQSEREARR